MTQRWVLAADDRAGAVRGHARRAERDRATDSVLHVRVGRVQPMALRSTGAQPAACLALVLGTAKRVLTRRLVAQVGNSWRTTQDISLNISASWAGILENLDGNTGLSRFARKGAWNDADMLEVPFSAAFRACAAVAFSADMDLYKVVHLGSSACRAGTI